MRKKDTGKRLSSLDVKKLTKEEMLKKKGGKRQNPDRWPGSSGRGQIVPQ